VTLQDPLDQLRTDRNQQMRRRLDIAAASLAADPHAAARIDALLAEQRYVINILRRQNVSDEAGADTGLGITCAGNAATTGACFFFGCASTGRTRCRR